MSNHEFPVAGPIRVVADIRQADLLVHATDSDRATVVVTAAESDSAPRVEMIDGALHIEVPPGAAGPLNLGGKVRVLVGGVDLFGRGSTAIRVEARVPTGSQLHVRSGAGDVTTTGRLSEVEARTGSGDLDLAEASEIEATTGSGDVRAGTVGALRLATGSGDVQVGHVTGRAVVRTGSGDVVTDVARDLEAVTGSGDLTVRETVGSVQLRSGSGDVEVRKARRGEVAATTASGDIHVAVADGTAALLDCRSVSGRVRSTLQETDAPGTDEDRVELHLRAISGDVTVSRI